MHEHGRQVVYELNGWEVDLRRRELRAQGVPVPLGNRAFQIFAALVESAVNSSPRTNSWPLASGRARWLRRISCRFTYPRFARRSEPIERRCRRPLVAVIVSWGIGQFGR